MFPEPEAKGEHRREALRYLARRSAVSLPASAIHSGLQRAGHRLTHEELQEALLFLMSAQLDGQPLVTRQHDPLGSQLYYQVTAAGSLHDERHP